MAAVESTALSSDKFTILFIGSGNITFGNDNVKWNHSLKIEKCLGSRLEVVGIVDPSVERVELVMAQKRASIAAESYSGTRHYLTLEEASSELKMRKTLPRLIILAAPPHFRGTMLPGRNLEHEVTTLFGPEPTLFCEKPISTALPHESLPVIELLKQAGNTISIGYMLRYLKVVQRAMSIITDNELKIMGINARYTCAYSRIRKVDWWDKAKQGGPIVEQASHFADLCRYLGGDVALDTVHAHALESYEPAGKLSHMLVDESAHGIPEELRIPRATSAIWKFQNGALGTLTHLIALHGMKYSNEIVVTADGYQLRLVDLYTTPTLYLRTPEAEDEECITFPGDDPFLSEFATLLLPTVPSDASCVPEDPDRRRILSTYEDAYKTYEFTWKIRQESELSSQGFLRN